MPIQDSNSVKKRILGRLLDIPKPLIAEDKFRKIELKRTLYLLEPVKPSIHLVIGDERVIEQDIRGYRCEFIAHYKLMVADGRDPYMMTVDAIAFVQEKIEADEQLLQTDGTGLASKITYDGEMIFTEELTQPNGGAVVSYFIEYRRRQAQPAASY